MFKFFKRFRYIAVQNNSVIKYVLYALGEIVLITVGILIALQINNNNERQKNEAKVNKMLTQVQRDLLSDIQLADQIIQVYEHKDSLMERVLNSQVDEQEYQRNPEYYSLITAVFTFELKDENYKNLIRSSDIVDSRYDSLISELDKIYLTNKAGIDEINNALSHFSTSLLEHWALKFPWYYFFFQGRESAEAMDYFINSPFYKNAVATYQTYSSENLLMMAKNQKINSALTYQKIAKALNQTGPYPETITNIVVEIDAETQNKMVGVYRISPQFSIEITRQGNQLFAQATNQGRFALYPKSDSVLEATIADIKIIFKEDSSSADFAGFELVQGQSRNYFSKEK